MRPERSYLLCTMPRSGSTLLCDLLGQTGVAGRPNSFFRPQSMADFAGDWGIPAQTLDQFDLTYLQTAIVQGTADTGCFGMRIMQNNIPGLVARLMTHFPHSKTDRAALEAAFGPLAYIHLVRGDQVAEAVSYAIAEQSGLWHRHADGSERERSGPATTPVYDAALIAETYRIVTEGHAAWKTWFAAQGITPYPITYEDLAADPAKVLRALLQFLGLDTARADHVAPATARLANDRNRDWAARFRAETGLAPKPPGS